MINNDYINTVLNAFKLGHIEKEEAKEYIMCWGADSKRFNWFSAKIGYSVGAITILTLKYLKII